MAVTILSLIQENHKKTSPALKTGSHSMLFRASFLLSYLIFAINISALIKTDSGNLIDKMGFFLSACIYVSTRRVDHFVIKLFCLVLFMAFALAALTDYDEFKWSIFLNSLNQLFIIFALIAAYPSKKDRDTVLKGAAILPILCTTIGFIYQTAGIQSAFGIEFSTGLHRLQGSLIPAYLSGVAMCGTFAALQLLLTNPRFTYIFIANILILLSSGGRAALIVTILTCGATVFLKKGVKINKKLIFFFCGLLSLIPIFILFGDRLITRFTSSGANGRDIMWEYLWNFAGDYSWTGIGFGHQFFAVPREISVIVGSAAAHNDYIRLTVELGYIGATLFYLLLTIAMLRVFFRQTMPGDLVMITAFIGFLLLSRTDNALASPSYFPLVFLALLSSLAYKETRTVSKIGTHMPIPKLRSKDIYSHHQ